MKLKDLASKPQLIEIVIDEPALVEKYGEELSFHVHDKLPIATYTKMASLNQKDTAAIYDIMKELILDEAGQPVISGEMTLPLDLINAAVVKVTERLGK
jgi:hypothetical protein